MTKKKILIIDDEDDIRAGVIEFGQDLGYEMLEAANGADGYYKLEQSQPDAILLDLNMPGLNGLELLRQIKKRYPHIMVIVITGAGSRVIEAQIRQMGQYGYIEKPFDVEALFKEHISPKLAS